MFRNTGAAISADGDKNLYKTTAHWDSSYRKTNSISDAPTEARKQCKGTRPLWSYPREAYNCTRAHYSTEATESLGTYGFKPREVLHPEADALPKPQTQSKYLFV